MNTSRDHISDLAEALLSELKESIKQEYFVLLSFSACLAVFLVMCARTFSDESFHAFPAGIFLACAFCCYSIAFESMKIRTLKKAEKKALAAWLDYLSDSSSEEKHENLLWACAEIKKRINT